MPAKPVGVSLFKSDMDKNGGIQKDFIMNCDKSNL